MLPGQVQSLSLHCTSISPKSGGWERPLGTAGKHSPAGTHKTGYDDINHRREIRLLLRPKPRERGKLNGLNLVLPYLIYVKASCWLWIWKCVPLEIVLTLIICRLESVVKYIFKRVFATSKGLHDDTLQLLEPEWGTGQISKEVKESQHIREPQMRQRKPRHHL